jgi:hypothetical protein
LQRKGNESSSLGEKDLREVQDHSALRRDSSDLRQPQAQATSGIAPVTRRE